jgi:hypothetical protein
VLVFPEDDLIMDLIGWNILGEYSSERDVISRILPGVTQHSCGATH